MLTCADTPEVPAKGARSKAAARYVVDLYDAHQDCFTKLGGVRQLVGTAPP